MATSDCLVFISHSSKDRWIAQQIARLIEERDVRTFLDEKDIQGGEAIHDSMKNLRTEPRLSHDRKKPVRVFLSYTVADREAARQVADALSAAARVRIFTTEMLSAGEDWQSKLRKEIASSDLFVLLLSSETRRSNYVLQELGAAWALDIPVVAVLEHPPFRNLDFHPDMTIASNHTVLLDELRNPEVVQDILSFYDEASEADTAA